MYFTTEEKKAIIASVTMILASDGTDVKEGLFMKRFVLPEISADTQTFAEAMNCSLNKAVNIIGGFSYSQKQYVKALWIEAIKADDDVTEIETEAYFRLCELCDIDPNI